MLLCKPNPLYRPRNRGRPSCPHQARLPALYSHPKKTCSELHIIRLHYLMHHRRRASVYAPPHARTSPSVVPSPPVPSHSLLLFAPHAACTINRQPNRVTSRARVTERNAEAESIQHIQNGQGVATRAHASLSFCADRCSSAAAAAAFPPCCAAVAAAAGCVGAPSAAATRALLGGRRGPPAST